MRFIRRIRNRRLFNILPVRQIIERELEISEWVAFDLRTSMMLIENDRAF